MNLLRAAIAALCLYMIAPTTGFAKVLTIAIGSVAGGGPDINARLLARHLPKYLPEGTKVVVQNMPGAGGLVVANWLYNVADPNTTIGSFTVLGNTLLNALVGDPQAKFDVEKFHWLFSTSDGADNAIVLWANNTRGLKDVKQLMEPNEFVIGNQASGENNLQKILLQDVAGIKSKFIMGYKDVVQALTINEIDARVGTLLSARSTNPQYLEKDYHIRPILQMGRATRHPDLPDVPLITEFISDARHYNILKFFNNQVRLARIFVAPPGADPHVVDMYLQAAKKVQQDPEYLAEAHKINLDVNFIHAKELRRIVRDLVKTPPVVLDYIKKLGDN